MRRALHPVFLALAWAAGAVGCAEGQVAEGSCTADDDCHYLTDACNVGFCNLDTELCTTQPHVGAICDDTDACTADDACNAEGECVGEPYECTPSSACVDAACDGEGSCTETLHPNACLIGAIQSVCYLDGDEDPARPCFECDPTQDQEDWTQKPAGTACGEATETCEPQRVCEASGECIAQGYPSLGTPCGDTPLDCEQQDTCDGVGHCADRGFAFASTVCRPSTGGCDPAETCTGTSAECPADQHLGDGDDCGICRRCDGAGQCLPNSVDHADCTGGSCLKCESGGCVSQALGEDLRDLCPLLTCTDYLFGSSSGTCYRYAAETDYNGDCGGAAGCATAAQACQGQGTAVTACPNSACNWCPPGGTAASACYDDYLQHGCDVDYACIGGDCVYNPISTCPTVYTWTGSSFETETNINGASRLATLTATGYRRPTPDDYYVLGHEPAGLAGSLELRLVEEWAEVIYLDRTALFVAEVPEWLDVMTERLPAGSSSVPLAETVHTVSQVLQPPVAATHVTADGGPVSVLTELAARDGVPVVLGHDRNLDFDYETIELDLGDLSTAPQVKLAIFGRMQVPNTPEGIERRSLFGPLTKIEVRDANGEWVAVPQSTLQLPCAPEYPRPFVVDLTPIFLTSTFEVRLTWLFKHYLDAILLDTTLDVTPDLYELPLESADLRFYGHSQRVGGELYELVYGAVDQELWPPFGGFYTRFGDVTSLLESVDDKFAIMWSGDEIAVRFTPPPPVAPNVTRRFILHGHAYYKDQTSVGPREVEPLPFNAMSNYPYDPLVESYPEDPDHVAYRHTYNTRHLP